MVGVPYALPWLTSHAGLFQGIFATGRGLGMAERTKVIRLKEVKPSEMRANGRPSKAQVAYLQRGLEQPGGKLPLFDLQGQRISERTVRSCIEQGWAEPWFNNPLKPDWLVCKLTEAGRQLLQD